VGYCSLNIFLSFPLFLSLELLADVQYAFGLPFYPAYSGQFSLEEKSLSLKIMQYFSNFIRSG
jgi:thyroglobulin